MSSRSDSHPNVAITTSKVTGTVNTLKVKSNAHPVEVYADMATWDTVSNAFVKPEDTNLHAGK